jgi:hypothetical protein
LSDADSFGRLECALEVGREDVSNLQILLGKVASQTIGLKNAMVRERRVCRASTESKVISRKCIEGGGRPY